MRTAQSCRCNFCFESQSLQSCEFEWRLVMLRVSDVMKLSFAAYSSESRRCCHAIICRAQLRVAGFHDVVVCGGWTSFHDETKLACAERSSELQMICCVQSRVAQMLRCRNLLRSAQSCRFSRCSVQMRVAGFRDVIVC